ncbi:hypothetical protein ACRN9Z_00470 [Shewanella frigidimarina]|uniref:hypothetical protein n=1 Tax=Shewanella frigidimarina TaxID=56812 RepID=UPI003D7B0589
MYWLKKLSNLILRAYKYLSPAFRSHLITTLQFILTAFFSLLPLVVSAAVKATENNHSYSDTFFNMFVSDSVFIYTSAFIAPFFIFTCIYIIKERKAVFYFYPFVVLLSFYSLILGALFYSGVVSRDLFDLGSNSAHELPTKADISILLASFLSWYYCTYKTIYVPDDSMSLYEKEDESIRNKFDEVTKDA